jgi:hypothetical protein
MVLEPVRVHVDPALAAAAGDHVVDAAGGQRAAVVHPEPQLRPVRLGVPGADPDVPVDSAGSVVADLDGPGLPAFPADSDLALSQVDVAALRVTGGAVPDACQFRQPDPSGPEHSDDHGVAALLEPPARAGTLEPWQFLAGEDRDRLVGDARGLHPRHRVPERDQSFMMRS